MPYVKARLIHHLKLIDEAGGIEEYVVWAIPMSGKYPEGIRYRLAYIPKGARAPVVLYDNHHPKGHHKHLWGQESPYQFSTKDQLYEDFKKDMEAAR